MSYQNNNPMNIMMNGINNPMNNQGNPNNQMNPFYNSNNSVNNNQIQNQSSINNFPPNEQYAYSMNNMKSDSFSLLNKIVNSILIEAHNHPLYSCYVHRNNVKFWTCNNCGYNYESKIPAFYCTNCQFNLCQNCLNQYPLHKIRLYDYSKNEYFNIPLNQNNSNLHLHFLAKIGYENYNNNNYVIHCKNCRNDIKLSQSFFYCSLCNYYVCENCFNNSQQINQQSNNNFVPNNQFNNMNMNNINFNQMQNSNFIQMPNNNFNLFQINNSNNQNNNNFSNNNYNNMPNPLQQNMNVQNQNKIFPVQIIPNSINNNNFMNNNQIPSLNIKYPHKTGLKNLLQTCYMNATIQCLSNIKDLTDYLLGHLGKLDVNKQPLTTQYTNLLSELFYSKQKYIDPSLFKKVVGELNPLFQGLNAGDSKDLLFYILEAIHNELTPEQKNVNKNKKDFYQLELESKDEQKMLQNFFDDFNSKNKSKIYDIFYGITRSTMKCNNCNITKYSFQMFNMQIFQLKKLKEDKMAELGEYYINNEKLNILDAFLNQQKEEQLIQENMIYCNTCKGLYNGVHQQVIYGLPKVLIIILNRGRDNLDFNDEFIFPDILDLKNTGVQILNKDSFHKYYLCGIITHFGESGGEGHFAAYCRNSSTDNFTFYNDTAVTESISKENAMRTVISNDSSEKRTPYILFYNSLE